MAESCVPLSSGGYDCDFVDSIPDSLSCLVCLLPFRDPHLLDCCGIKICATCVGRIDATDQPCPQCRERFVHIQDKGTTRQVLGLKTRCSRKKDGCKWEGELRHLYTHEKDECEWALVVCRYMCGASFPRSQLAEHEYHVCPRRPVDVKLESFMCKVEAKLALERDCHQKEIAAVKEQFNKILYDERESHRRELAVVRKELTDVLDKERESRKREIAALREEFKSFCQAEPGTSFWKERRIQAEKYAISKQQLTRQFCVTETMDDRGISQLSSSQIKELKREASLKHVNIEFGRHPSQSKIELQGSQADVLHMKNKIWDILRQGHKVGSSSAAKPTYHMPVYKPSKPTPDLWTTSGMGKPWHVAPNLAETSADMDKVEAVEPNVEHCEISRTVCVAGISNDKYLNVAALKLYFGNKNRSGGGDIELVRLLEDRGKVQITFKEHEVALAVAQRKHPKLGPSVEITVVDPLGSSGDSELFTKIPSQQVFVSAWYYRR